MFVFDLNGTCLECWKDRIPRVSKQPSSNQIVVENDEKFCFFLSFFSSQFLMLSIKDWTSLVQSLVDSGCTISAEVKVRTHELYFYNFFYYLHFEVNFLIFDSISKSRYFHLISILVLFLIDFWRRIYWFNIITGCFLFLIIGIGVSY